MRIALIITELDPGGAEQRLVQLAHFLVAHGHVVEVFALGPTPNRSLGSTPHREALTRQLERAGIPWKCGPARGAASLLKASRWLQSELTRLQPDIVQSMLFHANVVTALANRKLKKPHLGGARVAQVQWWRQVAQRWAARRMDRLVCVSQSVANHCQQIEKIPSSKLVVIPNGVADRSDSTPYSRPLALQSCLPSQETPFLIFVGRLSQQKGIKTLIQHVDELLEPLPNHHFVLLGDGPLMQDLKELIRSTRSGSRVQLLGWQPSATDWMRHATLLLLPSNYEGMPNVVLEAMQSGIPVVVFNVHGVEELLGDSNIQIVSGGMPEFIQRIHQLASDAHLAQSVAQHNQQRIAANFRLQDQLAKYELLYEQLLSTQK